MDCAEGAGAAGSQGRFQAAGSPPQDVQLSGAAGLWLPVDLRRSSRLPYPAHIKYCQRSNRLNCPCLARSKDSNPQPSDP